MAAVRDLALLAGRMAIAAVFIYDATLLVRFPEANMAFMERFGVPGALLWPTAAFQFFGGLALVLGLATRLAGLAFAGFCAMTALVFHNQVGEISEAIQFGKDFGLAGGFLMLAVSGGGGWSLDARLGTDLWPLRRAAS
jgi:putative oxidoreductase